MKARSVLHRSRRNAYQHLVVVDDWFFDLLEFKNIGGTIFMIDHCFHPTLPDDLILGSGPKGACNVLFCLPFIGHDLAQFVEFGTNDDLPDGCQHQSKQPT